MFLLVTQNFIFCRYCQLLSLTLNELGMDNVCLHGYMRQKERVSALNRFKSKHVRTLIATDVAARGLDIPSVELVINHRLPRTPKEYIHRVGRTARAGRKGIAISIFRFPRDLELLGEIEESINTKLTEHPIDRKFRESAENVSNKHIFFYLASFRTHGRKNIYASECYTSRI